MSIFPLKRTGRLFRTILKAKKLLTHLLSVFMVKTRRDHTGIHNMQTRQLMAFTSGSAATLITTATAGGTLKSTTESRRPNTVDTMTMATTATDTVLETAMVTIPLLIMVLSQRSVWMSVPMARVTLPTANGKKVTRKRNSEPMVEKQSCAAELSRREVAYLVLHIMRLKMPSMMPV